MQPHIYSATTHHIRPEQIDPHALQVIKRLMQAGFTCYLVGGSVRDLLLGHTPKDFDLSTSAKPEEIKRLFRNCLLIGRRFRLAHIRFGSKILEVSTFRTGDTQEESLILRDNSWGTPEEDVLRRDFTLNGLFYCPIDNTLIDYVEGYRDLTHRLLRTIGDPEVRFKQDPVRMIRLLKFRARFGFAVDNQTWKAIQTCKLEILKSSPARVLEELLKMLESKASAPFFQMMTSTQLLKPIFPQIHRFLTGPKGNLVFQHLEVIDRIASQNKRFTPDRSILMACLLFPIVEEAVTQLPDSHLADPSSIAHVINETLEKALDSPFAAFPKKIRANLIFLLNAQYRLTPLGDKKNQRSRIIHHPDFSLAMTFLQIRAQIYPHCDQALKYWQNFSAPRPPKKKPEMQNQLLSDKEFLETI